MIAKLTAYIALVLLAVGFVGPAGTVLANSSDLSINLVAAPAFQGAKGTAKFRNREGEKELQVEVEDVRLAGTTLTVMVNGASVATITLDASGKGRVDLNSKLGQTVPAITAGSQIAVTTAGGDIVLAGQF